MEIVEKSNRPPVAEPEAATSSRPACPPRSTCSPSSDDPDNTPGGMTLVSASKLSGDGQVTFAGRVVTITPNPARTSSAPSSPRSRSPTGQARPSSGAGHAERPEAAESSTGRPRRQRRRRQRRIGDRPGVVQRLGSGRRPVEHRHPVGTRTPRSARPGSPVNGSIAFTAAPGASGIADDRATRSATANSRATPGCGSRCGLLGVAAGCADGFLRTGYQQPIAVDLNAYGSNGVVRRRDRTGGLRLGNGVYTPPAGENGNVTINYTRRQRLSPAFVGQRSRSTSIRIPSVGPQSFTIGRGEERRGTGEQHRHRRGDARRSRAARAPRRG